jgi:hypothetical protein
MGVENEGAMTSDYSSGDASMGGQHDAYPSDPLKVASTDGSTRFNLIRIPLVPVACWRYDDPGFAFDSSFVSPAFRDDVTLLREILQKNAGCPAALFGHCDPAGSDELNKTLGDRRAIAVYALLTRQPDMWADIYDHPAVGDSWGTAEIQCMLQCVVDGRGKPYYRDIIDDKYGADTTAAVKAFQGDCGQPATGQADAATRKVLFGAYMDWLCRLDTPPTGCTGGATSGTASGASPDAAPQSLMKPEDFVGGQGAAKGDLPKMSLQGCSKFNPVVLLPDSEMNTKGDTTMRNEDDAQNRRVVMFLFPANTTVDPSVWPCPKVHEPYAGCKDAFWRDGEQRRKNTATLRVYSDTRDTMACRFYDRFARRSPCELGLTVRVWLQDDSRQRMPNVPYRLTVGTARRTGTADADGLLTQKGMPFKTRCYVEWGQTTQDESSGTNMYPHARMLQMDLAADPQGKALANLAYNTPPTYESGGGPTAASDTSGATAPLAAFLSDYPNDTPQNVHEDGTPVAAPKASASTA